MTGVERRIRGTTYPPHTAVLLCASPRVGSTLLCDLLTTTGVLGHPKEVFFPASEQACAAAWGTPDPEVDYGAYLRAAVTDGTSTNGVFTTKVMWRDARRLRDKLVDPTAAPVVDELCASVRRTVAVHLRRADALAAAISELRAEATGEWSTTGGPAPAPAIDTVDWDRLEHLHRAQHRAERAWGAVLRLAGVPVVDLVYEEWSREPATAVAAVAGAVGVETGDVDGGSPLRIQRDGWNAAVRDARHRRIGPCPRCR